MKVFVNEVHSVAYNDIVVSLFEDEDDAYMDACKVALHAMEHYGCDDPTSEYNKYYSDVLNSQASGCFNLAIERFDEWQDDAGIYDDKLNIRVYSE